LKELKVGDKVFLNRDWEPGVIKVKIEDRKSYVAKLDKGSEYWRKVDC
jgi:hypothetical protein